MWKLKLDEKGNVVVQDGKPVYVKEDGTEIAFDAFGTTQNITRLNGEAKANRERAETAEAALKPFKDAGITDPAAAATALQTVKNLDSKKLVDAGEVEKVRQEAIKATEEKFAPVVAERDKFKSDLVGEKIGGSFARSKFIAEKCAVPADIIQARFGNLFALGEDGKVTAKDANGNVIYSKSTPGTPADFDEALEIAIEQYPYKAQILKGTGANGSGTNQGPRNTGGKATITRSAFEQLSPYDRQAALKDKELVDG